MAMSSDLDAATGPQRAAGRLAHIRIAIPSFRWMGAESWRRSAPALLSREELLSIFGGEFTRLRQRPKLTEREKHEREIARSIRQALYPA
ncbi:MAG: hypothetical protein ACKVPY_00120 [Paracoccaceae bacterium]